MVSTKIPVKIRKDGYKWKDPSCQSQLYTSYKSLLSVAKGKPHGPAHRMSLVIFQIFEGQVSLITTLKE